MPVIGAPDAVMRKLVMSLHVSQTACGKLRERKISTSCDVFIRKFYITEISNCIIFLPSYTNISLCSWYVIPTIFPILSFRILRILRKVRNNDIKLLCLLQQRNETFRVHSSFLSANCSSQSRGKSTLERGGGDHHHSSIIESSN